MAKQVTGNTTNPVGIIKFGSTDESVVYQHALDEKPAIGTELGTGISYDANGLNTNGTGALQLDLSSLDFTSLTRSGQISFDIISTAIGHAASYNSYAHTGSDGGVPDVDNDYLLSWSDEAGTAGKAGRLFLAAGNVFEYQMEWGDTNGEFSQRLTNHGRSTEYETITLSWHGDVLTMYISGSPFSRLLNGIQLPADLFKYITVSSYQNRDTTAFIASAGRLIKNIIVSNRPVMLAGHPMLSKIVFMGDSFGIAAATRSLASTTRFNYQPARIVSGYLGSRGLKLSAPTTDLPRTGSTNHSYTSTSVNASVIDDTGTAAAKIGDTVTATLAEKPSIISINGGINDVRKGAGYDIAVFETEYKSLLSALLAAGESTQKVFVNNIISHIGDAAFYTAQSITRTAEINAVINALPAWWDAANPSDTGRVIVVDIFNAFGGEPANDNTILGRWNINYPSYDNELHPSSYGGWIMGNELGKAIFKNLG